jgi:hypothetical protein
MKVTPPLTDWGFIAHGAERLFRLLQYVFDLPARGLSRGQWERSEWTAAEEKIRTLQRDRYTAGWWVIESVLVVFAVSLFPGPPPYVSIVVSLLTAWRIVDIVQLNVNKTIFDSLRAGADYRQGSTIRSLIVAVTNYVELLLCFGILYCLWPTLLIDSALERRPPISSPFDALYFSVVTQLTIGYGDIVPKGLGRVVAALQAILGFGFALVILGRVVSVLPTITGMAEQPVKGADGENTAKSFHRLEQRTSSDRNARTPMYACATRVWSWFKRVGRWLATPRLFWVSSAIVVVAGIVALRPGTSEPVIRWTGLILQLLGIGTVIIGIEQTRRLFDHPTLLNMVAEWLKQFPRYRQSVVISVGAGAIAAATAKARGYVTSSPPPKANIDERVASLESNIGHLNKRIDDVYTELDSSIREQTAVLDKEHQDRVAQDSRIASKLETLGTGGLHISAVGALWLVIGVILGTASTEIARWLR